MSDKDSLGSTDSLNDILNDLESDDDVDSQNIVEKKAVGESGEIGSAVRQEQIVQKDSCSVVNKEVERNHAESELKTGGERTPSAIVNDLETEDTKIEKLTLEKNLDGVLIAQDNLKDENDTSEVFPSSLNQKINTDVNDNVELLSSNDVRVPVFEKNGAEKIVIKGATEDDTSDFGGDVSNEEKLEDSGITDEDDTDLETLHAKVSRGHDENHIITQFLDHCNDDAEARLLARRQARAEAREIRMRELERQQKEQEENADRQYDMLEATTRTTRTTGNKYLSSRRSSEDSLEDGGSLREMREENFEVLNNFGSNLKPKITENSISIKKHELKDVEEKFRKAMIANAQLDNDKAAQTYQLELLKDRLEELEEEHSRLRREHRDKCREHDQLKRLAARLKEDLAVTRFELEERDKLIAEKGLVIVIEDIEEEQVGIGDTSSNTVNCVSSTPKKALVSAENAQLLESVGEGSLDVRLARFGAEKRELQDQISHLRLELEEERSKRRKPSGVTLNGPTSEADYDADDTQKDVGRQLADYKFRAQKAEQDVATLQTTVARLETQVVRYKSAAELYEKSEEALKQEKRKLQRESREAQNRAEELETANTHLLKRLDKLKNAKSALLKEL